MQVVIRMQDVERLTEVVDAVDTNFGFSPDTETHEGPWCVALYTVDREVNEVEAVVKALLGQIKAHGLLFEDAAGGYTWDMKIS